MRARLAAAVIPALLLIVGGGAIAQDHGPYIDTDGPRNYTPDQDGTGIYVQDDRLRWYHATFFERCNDLPNAFTVGFKTFDGRLERGSTVLAGSRPCRIATIRRSGPPPEWAEHPKRRKAG